MVLIGCLNLVRAIQAQDVQLTGSLTLHLSPAEAVADGATWSVDDGPSHPSDFHQNSLSPGIHTLRITDIPGWREPAPISILIIGGKENNAAVTLTPLDSFYFKNIPEQHARAGSRVEFLVRSSDASDPDSPPGNTPLTVAANPAPTGSMSFNPGTGLFQFNPGPTDRLPFTVSFRTPQGTNGSFTLSPMPLLNPEESVIEYDRPIPDAESRDYLSITETKNAAKLFNDAQQETLSVAISGPTIVLEQGHEAHLFEVYNQRANIENFDLFADRVIIRSTFELPQTHVTIHARELRFEGSGQLVTTPKARQFVPSGIVWTNDAVVGINGDAGHDAGDCDVFIERFHSDPTQTPRFVLMGGAGGAAGDGRNGLNEGDVGFLSADWSRLMSRCGIPVCGTSGGSSVIVYSEDRFANLPPDICGSKISVHGENAVRSGFPGVGGRGGVLRSTLNLTGFAQLNGGPAGAKAADHVAGQLSARKFIYTVTKTIIKNGQEITTSSSSNAPKVAGKNEPAPAAPAPFGPSGSQEIILDPSAWVHSFSVRRVIEYCKDAYLNGRIPEARAFLDDYRQILRAFQKSLPTDTTPTDSEFAEKVNQDQALEEVEALIQRMDSNLDYFGNPAGWVPMLSFEANLVAFQNEVQQSLPILYLAYFLNHAATNLESSLGATTQARDRLETELEKMISDFNEAQNAIPKLDVESRAITLQIQALNGQLNAKLVELEQRAEQNVEDRHKVPFWKKALGVLGVAADLIPVGQPAVGKIGSGIALLGQIDTDHPLDSASKLAPKAIEAFSQKNITVCFGGTNTTKVPTNSVSGTNTVKKAKQDKLQSLTECGKFLGGELKELADIFKSAQVDKTELAAELEKLKATDPIFNDLTQQVKDLNAQKEKFALELASALQIVAGLSSQLNENLIATHELESRLEAGFAALDHGALLHIKAMERRAKDRLLQYQYFLAKAFQYRRLKPYTGNLQLTRLLDRFQVLIEAGSNPVLTSEQFDQLKSLFIDELREIVSDMFDNFNAPERSVPISFKLNADELAQLNSTGRLLINLKDRGLLGATRENVRIADLRTRSLSAHPVGGSIGTHALLNVNFEHLGTSRLTSGGKTFLFRHYQTEAVNPIVWNTVFDGLTGQVSNSELSVAQQSLIAVLLGLVPTADSNLAFFSIPGADADILITKEVNVDNQIDLAIDDIRIEVQFDFFNTTGNQRELSVVVPQDLAPRIVVSQQDINQRQDGEGDFTREFAPFSQVTLTAPESYGRFQFDHWIVNGVQAATPSTSVVVTLNSNTSAEARFRENVPVTTQPVLAPVASAPPGQVGFTFNTQTGARYTIEKSSGISGQPWIALEQRTGDGSPAQFTRSIEASAASFFRVRVE